MRFARLQTHFARKWNPFMSPEHIPTSGWAQAMKVSHRMIERCQRAHFFEYPFHVNNYHGVVKEVETTSEEGRRSNADKSKRL